MTKQEFAKKLSEELRLKPTTKNTVDVTNKILSATVDGAPITESVALEIVGLIETEIGDLFIISEQFDNHEQIKVMQQMHQLMNQANLAKKQSTSSGQSGAQQTGGKK